MKVSMKNGKNIDGCFHTATPFEGQDFMIALKAITTADAANNGNADIGKTLVTNFASSISTMHINNVALTSNQVRIHTYHSLLLLLNIYTVNVLTSNANTYNHLFLIGTSN